MNVSPAAVQSHIGVLPSKHLYTAIVQLHNQLYDTGIATTPLNPSYNARAPLAMCKLLATCYRYRTPRTLAELQALVPGLLQVHVQAAVYFGILNVKGAGIHSAYGDHTMDRNIKLAYASECKYNSAVRYINNQLK